MQPQQQSFPIIYKTKRMMVDPQLMCASSRKFVELYQGNYNNMNIMDNNGYGNNDKNIKFQLTILNEKFSERNIDNFLKLCQNLPTDVKDSEMMEICEIAKMFQADSIYNTGIDFVRKSINMSFSVPETILFENNFSFSTIKSNENVNDHSIHNINDLDFGDDDDDDNDDDNDNDSNYRNNENDTNNNKNSTVTQKGGKKKRDPTTVIYEIIVDKTSLFKCTKYYFKKNGETLFTAKRKSGLVVIGRGNDVHVSTPHAHVGKIIQKPMWNSITAEDQNIVLKYIICSKSAAVSMNVSFVHQGVQLCWYAKEPTFNKRTKQYALKLSGGFHRRPITSRRNAALRNGQGQLTYIVRKMADKFYEAECNPTVPPLIVCAIALSAIIGPSIEANGSAIH